MLSTYIHHQIWCPAHMCTYRHTNSHRGGWGKPTSFYFDGLSFGSRRLHELAMASSTVHQSGTLTRTHAHTHTQSCIQHMYAHTHSLIILNKSWILAVKSRHVSSRFQAWCVCVCDQNYRRLHLRPFRLCPPPWFLLPSVTHTHTHTHTHSHTLTDTHRLLQATIKFQRCMLKNERTCLVLNDIGECRLPFYQLAINWFTCEWR